jgi:hypothetical protein
MPPSTTMSAPLTNVERSEASHSTHWAMSSGMPARGIGCALAKFSLNVAAAASAWARSMPSAMPRMPVAIGPGDTELTRTLCSPRSMATQRVRWFTAALAAP